MLGVLLMLCATAVGTAKTAYFYFPLLMAFFVFPVFRGKFSVWKFALLVIACQGISFLPVYSGAYQQFNTYHAVYFGALDSISKDRSIEIEAIGEKPVLHECIGVVAYSSLGPDCIGRANASYGDVVQLVMSHPEVAASMVSRVFSEGKNIDISYLAKHSSELPSFSDLRIFNVVPYIFRYGLNYLVVVLLIISVVLLLGFRRYMNDVELAMMKTGMFFAMVAFSQHIASLADGFYEITKHMVIGNYSIGCSFVFLFPALVLTIATQIQRRN